MRRLLISLASILGLTFMVWSPTQADSFSIPLDTVVRADEGTEHLLATDAVPEGWEGRTCTVTSTPGNNPSIHPGNNLRIESENSIILVDVEGESGSFVTTGGLTLNDMVRVYLIMGPDEVYSADGTVAFDCPPIPTTTEVEPSTTTTSSTTTTTQPEESTTTTTPAESTTTVVSSTSTTVPPESGSSTTSSTVPSSSPSTTVPPTVTTTPPKLPITGGNGDTQLFLATLLLAAGGFIVLTARRPLR